MNFKEPEKINFDRTSFQYCLYVRSSPSYPNPINPSVMQDEYNTNYIALVTLVLSFLPHFLKLSVSLIQYMCHSSNTYASMLLFLFLIATFDFRCPIHFQFNPSLIAQHRLIGSARRKAATRSSCPSPPVSPLSPGLGSRTTARPRPLSIRSRSPSPVNFRARTST